MIAGEEACNNLGPYVSYINKFSSVVTLNCRSETAVWLYRLITRFPKIRFNYVLGELWFHLHCFNFWVRHWLLIHLVWSFIIWPLLGFIQTVFVISFTLKLWFSDFIVCPNYMDSLLKYLIAESHPQFLGSVGLQDLYLHFSVSQEADSETIA